MSNNDLTDIREEMQNMGVPNLDTTTPIYTFNNTNSYTVTGNYWLVGSVINNRTVTINNIPYLHAGTTGSLFVCMKVKSGDTIKISDGADSLHICREL